MPQRRKRSAAITLVLAGSLSGCSEPVEQRDVYNSLADCQRDWVSQAQQCEPVRDGRYSSGWYYGPRYYGASWPNGNPKSSPSAIDAVRPTTASASSSRSWFSGHSSSNTSRGGFGGSARSSVS